MTGLLKTLALRLLKGRWGAILPALFRAAAEGDFGPQVKAVYWTTAKYKTMTGAVILGAGVALEAIAGSYPGWAWAAPAARWVYYAGAILTAVGLADGGTRAPWPNGTPREIPGQ